MRLLAVRNKARDIRLIAAALVGICALSESRWHAAPVLGSALLLGGVVLAGVASVLRAWAVLYIAGYKTEQLIMEGPFSICRNPIYLSTLIGLLGIALATRTFSLPVLVLLAFVPYFKVQVGGEERKMLAHHGARFAAYCRRTPRLIPDFRLLDEPFEYQVRPARFRHWLADGLWFVWGLGVVGVVDALHEIHALPVLWRLY